MLILPAIDLRGGQCVRLTQGDYARERVYDSDPVRVAQEFEAQGAPWIHVVDLDGAKLGEPQNWDALSGIASAVSIPIEVGGGVRSIATARRLLDLGVARVVVGTKLVQDEALARSFFEELGDKMVAGIDCRNGKVAVSGWTETSEATAADFARRMTLLGAQRIILTDIAVDGMLTGPNLSLLAEVSEAVNVPIIQSGGIGSLADIESLSKVSGRLPEGVIVGRAIYENKFSVAEAVQLSQTFLQ